MSMLCFCQDLLRKHGFVANLDKMSECVAANQAVLDSMVSDATGMFVNAAFDYHDLNSGGGDGAKQPHVMTKAIDVDKVQSTLKMLVRDWSEDGAEERDTCYKPILQELEALFPTRPLRQAIYFFWSRKSRHQ